MKEFGIPLGVPSIKVSVSVGADGGPPAGVLLFDDGMGASSGSELVYDFGLNKRIRAQTLQLLERDVADGSNWAGQAEPSPTALLASAAAASVGVSVGFGGVSVNASLGGALAPLPFGLDTDVTPEAVLREEKYQVDPNLLLDTSGSTTKAGRLVNPQLAIELARTRRKFLEAHGTTDCRRLGAGYRFTLGNHPIPALNQEYIVTSMSVKGHNPDFVKENESVYRCAFRCIPSTEAPIPPRPKKRPKLGLEMAQVVAYTDNLKTPWLESSACGYVKVRFRWNVTDRYGTPAGPLSAGATDAHAIWLPVMQQWAGAGYGSQFIPREGMDVLVGFLEEQGERPVILGCLYSAENLPPWSDQIGSQKIGIKSQTRPANGGYSEISIDDKQTEEVLTVRAQKDLTENVLNNQTTSIGNNRTTSVTVDDATTVGHNRSLNVTADNTETVGGNSTLNVAGALSQSVTGNRTETTGGDHLTTVQGQRTQAVTGSVSLTVQGDAATTLQGSQTLHIDGTASTVVGTEDAVGGYSDFYVYGDYTIGASGSVRIKALTSIVLQCGSTIVTLTPEALQAAAKAIAMAGMDRLFLGANGPSITLTTEAEIAAKTVNLYSSGASVVLDSNATVQASGISLGSGAPPSQSTSNTSLVPTTKSFNLTLTDPLGKPYANKTYKLLVDGVVTSGTTNGSGALTASIAPTAVLAHLTLWSGTYPEGPRLRWDIALTDSLAPGDSPRGVLDRLRNLGYFKGVAGDVMTDSGTAALQQFQKDKGLVISGVIDSATVAALASAHGH